MLRKELILIISSGGGYFLIFFFLDLIFAVIGGLCYLWISGRIKFKGINKKL